MASVCWRRGRNHHTKCPSTMSRSRPERLSDCVRPPTESAKTPDAVDFGVSLTLAELPVSHSALCVCMCARVCTCVIVYLLRRLCSSCRTGPPTVRCGCRTADELFQDWVPHHSIHTPRQPKKYKPDALSLSVTLFLSLSSFLSACLYCAV